ncbi:MAG TPA: 1-deoxy-D-xylulose-5-phosphate synthase [Burkholderiales bacterium]|nr:1-deoxy-D-xylulose-5-phosphate synthase [Burkholderiales bacterium]
MTEYLERINSPADLRALDRRELHELADELRAFLLDSVSQTGGHLASNLGTVELTVALHYAYHTPYDRLVWDVGHQVYAHKILTGRRLAMERLRMRGGISGFPRREESEFDTFGAGHSSTSISAALGMAVAARMREEDRKVVAIIGDGAMTAGMAFEALNNAGAMDASLLVVLNDNDMSISPNVGALNQYLAKLLASRFYSVVRRGGEKVLGIAPGILELAKRAEEHVKGMMMPGTLFEEFGFNYIGPIDGHDLDALISSLQNIRDFNGPQFLHVVTKKGKGYKLAEDDPCFYHGVTKFDPQNGMAQPVKSSRPSYTQVFGDWICDMASVDDRLVAITPAMREGSGLVRFAEEYPDRYFDVGIAEQHALTFAAGLACEGLKPVVAIYSTFLQRAYDQLIHDVLIQNLPVVFAVDRAGIVGADGATHMGAYDLSFLRCLPNMIVMAPKDENECRQMLYTAYRQNSPVVVRYPRGSGSGVKVEQEMQELPIGLGEVLRSGRQVAVCAFGNLVASALEAGEQINATVVNMRFIKPLDDELIATLARSHDLLVTVEENVVMGGAGSAIAESLARQKINIPILHLGLPDTPVEHGSQSELIAECGLDSAGILSSIRARLSE